MTAKAVMQWEERKKGGKADIGLAALPYGTGILLRCYAGCRALLAD